MGSKSIKIGHIPVPRLTVTGRTASNVSLSWVLPRTYSGVSAYELRYENTGNTVYTGANTSYTHANVPVSGVAARYSVRMMTTIGRYSDWSSISGITVYAPVISNSAPSSLSIQSAGDTYPWAQWVTDQDASEILTYSLPSRYSTSITINSLTGLMTVPGSLAGTSGNVTVQVTDKYGLTVSKTVAITVASAGNQPPVWQGSDPITLPSMTQGTQYTYTQIGSYASDPEGQPLTFDIKTPPPPGTDPPPTGFSIDPSTGNVTVAASVSVGTYDIVVGADDGYVAVTPAEQDWIDRSTRDGVVWAHNFNTASEVNQFRWTGGAGNDPGDLGRPGLMVWDSTDRTSGAGCMKVTNPAGDGEPPLWWRMFSPIYSPGNGRPTNDRGNGIALKTFSPSQGGNQTQTWVGGFYGPPSYVAADPTYYDGTSYYLQMRVKIDPNCTHAEYVRGGKIFWFCHTSGTSNGSQIVTISNASGYAGGPNYHNMYGLGQDGYGSIGYDSYSGQLGSDLGPPYCNYGPYSYYDAPPYNIAPCWAYSGGWDTLLYQVVPGEWGQNTTILRVWAAHEGIKTYTKIWDRTIAKSWDSPPPSLVRMGHNAIALGHYVNKFESNYSTTISSYHKFAEVIFSHSFIECPQA